MKKTIIIILIGMLFRCYSIADNPVVVMQTVFGDIAVELFESQAPVTVDNFLHYVNSGFFNDTVIHRIVVAPQSSISIVQGGGYVVSGYTIYSKSPDRGPIINESYNGLSNLRGTIAMARTSDPNSATSQFYFNQTDNTYLDKANNPDGYGYCVFGQVVYGMEVVDTMADIETFYINPSLQNFPIPIITIAWAFEAPEEYRFQSFAAGSDYWLAADFNYDGIVSHWDLHTFASSWLQEDSLGDLPVEGLVDFAEFAVFANSYMATSPWKRFAPGDVNNNMIVNFDDFALLAKDWQKNEPELQGDLNLDDEVNWEDFERFAYDWLRQQN